MVVVHVTHAVLREALRDTPAFRAADMAFGLVAPAFLVCVGASFAIRPEGPIRPRLTRAGLLFALGYAMHASGLVAYMRSGSRAELAIFAQADVLQVIACALSLLTLLAAVAPRQWPWASLSLGVLAMCVAPWASALAQRLPFFVAPYFSYDVATQFPLVPWLGYALIAAGALGLHARGVPLAGIAVTVASLVVIASLVPTPPHDVFRAGARHALARLALVAALALALRRAPLPAWVDAILALLGRRSLFLYVVHVALVYGRNPLSLRARVGPVLGPLGVATCVAGTLVVMLAVTWTWDRRARGSSSATHRVRSSRP